MERNAKSTSVTELRRIQVVYLINQGGPIEQPHLFRVHLQASRSGGICLRDIKRWLSDLRGKDFPDAFTWSYKRRSREGYIWQDIVDDDLLNPILENEYVLLGSSKLPFSPFSNFNDDEAMKNQSPEGKDEDSPVSKPDSPVLNNKLLESNSSDISTLLTDESLNLKEEYAADADAQPPPEYSSLDFRLLLSSISKKQQNNIIKNENIITDDVATTYYSSSSTSSAIAIPPSHLPKRSKSRRRSKGPSRLFCNFINCGATMNYDMMVNCRRPVDDPTCSPRPTTNRKPHQDYSAAPRKSWNVDTKDYPGQKLAVPAAAAYYKPVLGPTCSQCGKRFKPEKMHKHMKSCPGMKKAAEASSAARKSST